MRPALLLGLTLTLTTALSAGLTGCSNMEAARDQLRHKPVDIGLVSGFDAQPIAQGLNNPSGVTFSPTGVLTVCDTGNGRVVTIENGQVRNYITGFKTEYWKDSATTKVRRFQLGPLSAVWLGTKKLAVTDGGQTDGNEGVAFFHGPGDAKKGKRTNGVTSTTDALSDQGEGNLTGLVRGPGGRSLYMCGQGSDARTWILRCDVTDRNLWTFASTDVEEIKVNSPMQCLISPWRTLLVLYSGTGGKPDGKIVEWDLDTGGMLRHWDLPGLVDPMSMAFIPGSRDLAVVDNNWALTHVKPGQLARVGLPEKSGDAQVTILAKDMRGPTSCVFGPDRRLYVTELGRQFDKNLGRVIAISGF